MIHPSLSQLRKPKIKKVHFFEWQDIVRILYDKYREGSGSTTLRTEQGLYYLLCLLLIVTMQGDDELYSVIRDNGWLFWNADEKIKKKYEWAPRMFMKLLESKTIQKLFSIITENLPAPK